MEAVEGMCSLVELGIFAKQYAADKSPLAQGLCAPSLHVDNLYRYCYSRWGFSLFRVVGIR